MDQSNNAGHSAVSIEIAIKEVTEWLDYKKVSESKRIERKKEIETLASAISEGSLVLNKDDKTFLQHLKLPFGKDDSVKELNYKSRIPIDLIHMRLRNVKSDDADGRLLCHVSALTGQSLELLRKMDTEDYALAQAIAYFFL